MIQNIRLRLLKLNDVETVYELVQNTIAISYADVYPPEAIEFFKNHHSKENIIKDLKGGYVVAVEAGGQILGTGTLVGTNIRRVFISPQYQRQGIGKTIAAMLERKAKSAGLEKLDLSASLKSRRFWEAMGFVSSGEFALPVANDKKLIFYEMVKEVLK
jgi:N-acetylglutamate synthase-like GNAT family acetyltransferase